MKLEFTAFGVDLMNHNPHWVNVYGRLITFVSVLKLEETVYFLDYPTSVDQDESRFEESKDMLRELMEARSFYVEGYTFREVHKWFLWYVKESHAKNKEVQKKVKLEKIEKLKAEIKALENETTK